MDDTQLSHIIPVLHMHNVSTIFILHHSGTFVTINEPTLTHPYYPKPVFLLEFTFCVMHSMVFDKCIMTSIHGSNIIQNSFTISVHPHVYLSISFLPDNYICETSAYNWYLNLFLLNFRLR